MATLPHTWYSNFGDGSTTGYYALAKWTATTAYTVGQIVRQNTTPTVGNERAFICILAGTSLSTEPSWLITHNAVTTEAAGPKWCETSGAPAVNGDITNTPASSTERSQLVNVGLIVKNNAATFFFICTTSGTCGASEPSYNTTTGATTADGTTTWTCIGAVGSFSIWGAPMPRLNSLTGAGWAAANGDTIFVSAIHAEAQTSTISLTLGTTSSTTVCSVYCVANAPATTPPTVADITTGASISATGTTAAFNINNSAYCVGITFNCGTSTSFQGLNVANVAGSYVRLVNCTLATGGSGTQPITISNSRGTVILENCNVVFNGAAASSINFSGHVVWRDAASALSHVGTNWPTTMIVNCGGSAVLIENVDWSAFAGTQYIGSSSGGGRIVLKDSKINTGITFAATASLQGPTTCQVDLINTDGSAGNVYQHARYWYEGTQTVDTTAYLSGGASDGTTPYSWKIVTSANSTWIVPFESLPVSIWNSVTGSNVTVTMQCAYVGTALPNNDDIWISSNYYGTSGSTIGTDLNQSKTYALSANAALTASSASWKGPTRLNTNAYALGAEIAVASSGSVTRLFVCTTAGTSSGSLPGAYASATDGTQVTDGGAVFTAVVRCLLTVVLTGPQPQSRGYITTYVRAAKLSSTFYVDPTVTLS